jgi:hypothetical protein
MGDGVSVGFGVSVAVAVHVAVAIGSRVSVGRGVAVGVGTGACDLHATSRKMVAMSTGLNFIIDFCD